MARGRRVTVHPEVAVMQAALRDLLRQKEEADMTIGRCVQHILAGRTLMGGLLPLVADPVLDAALRAWRQVDPRTP